MRKGIRKLLTVLIAVIVACAGGTAWYLQQPMFGETPTGDRLQAIRQSPNYNGEQFQNMTPTPIVLNQGNPITGWIKFLLRRDELLKPQGSIPVVKTDLRALDKGKDIVVWLGHSSYFMQLGGKRILIDPVFSDYASPVFFANRAFPETYQYRSEDMPDIDYLLISHDHWDHLDYPTIISLKPKVQTVVCGLGVGTYFTQWGFDETIIKEGDWFDELKLTDDFSVHILPARHYSGRSLARNKTLWNGYALVTPQSKVFYSGDTGYGSHIKEISARFGGFDLAIIENGQYDANWPYIHMMPEEVSLAAEELNAGALLTAHSGKFQLANHPWDDPFKRITAASYGKNYRLLTPRIGEIVDLADKRQVFDRWWESVN